jgi:hypothetical protein
VVVVIIENVALFRRRLMIVVDVDVGATIDDIPLELL